MADEKPWNGNNVFRAQGYGFVPHGSTAARLLSGVMGPDPNQQAPAGFGGLLGKADGSFGTYGSGSQLASLLAGVNQATGGKVGAPPSSGPPQVTTQAPQQAANANPGGEMVEWAPGMGGYFSPFKTQTGQSVMDAYMARLRDVDRGGRR